MYSYAFFEFRKLQIMIFFCLNLEHLNFNLESESINLIRFNYKIERIGIKQVKNVKQNATKLLPLF